MIRFDVRALGLFRLGLGGVLLYDLVTRWFDFEAHYSELGVLPLEAVELGVWNHWGISPYFLSTDLSFLKFVYAYQVLMAVCFILGYKTRFCQLMSWYLLGSLQERNPLICYGADSILMILLFLSLFLPLDRAFSLTPWNRKDSHGQTRLMANLTYTIQVAVIYFFAALAKNGDSWFNGSAVQQALSLEQYSRGLGQALLNYPGILSYLTYLSLGIEFLAPLLLFFHRTRIWSVLLIAGLQLGFMFCMDLGIFPFVSLVALIPFISFRLQGIESDPSKEIAIIKVIHVILISIILYSNIVTCFDLKEQHPSLAWMLFITQEWNMFAPNPPDGDRWIVIRAINQNQEEIDLITPHKNFSLDKPHDFKAWLINDRWSEYFFKLSSTGNEAYLHQCIQYFLSKYSGRELTDLSQIELFILQESSDHKTIVKNFVVYAE